VSAHRPTILQIIPRLDTGGAELATVEIAAAVVAAGGRALVATEGGRLADRITADGGEIVPMAMGTKNPWRMWANARRLAELVTREQIDLLHARSRAPAWSALIAARRTGKPFVTTYHGAYAERGPAKRLYNSVMARGDVVIANSDWTARLIRSRYGTAPERIVVIPRGVDVTRFDPARIGTDRVAALRKDWGVPANAPIVLQAGRLTGWKGQRVLIAAAEKLARDGRLGDARIIFAGDAQGRDDYETKLHEQIRAAQLTEHVHIVGHVEDIAAAYAAAHVTVVASTEPEAFGRAAAEALAVGCPVIATNIGAPPETVRAAASVGEAEETGWLVPPDNASAMAAALAAALSVDGAARQAMGHRAMADMRARFTLSAMTKATLAVYDRLLGSGLSAGGNSGQAVYPSD
jgi:glycosyltransferase involved in cell wall biosynthesis